jgi:hypothetical protein
MLLLFDFKCWSCDHIEEKLVEREVRLINCSECNHESRRMISPVRCALDPHGGFPDATDKWTKRHETEGRMPSESEPNGW